MSEENHGHLSRERRGNGGVFCLDDRILLGRIAASLVLPLIQTEFFTGYKRFRRGNGLWLFTEFVASV